MRLLTEWEYPEKPENFLERPLKSTIEVADALVNGKVIKISEGQYVISVFETVLYLFLIYFVTISIEVDNVRQRGNLNRGILHILQESHHYWKADSNRIFQTIL